MGPAFNLTGQFYGLQDLFRRNAGCGSLFMVVFEAGDAIRRSGRPETDQKRSFFVHEAFPPWLII
jgi:hypothetical protein